METTADTKGTVTLFDSANAHIIMYHLFIGGIEGIKKFICAKTRFALATNPVEQHSEQNKVYAEFL